MVSLSLFAVFASLLVIVASTPLPGWNTHHKHVVIKVPYHVHTVHHHHVEKVHVPVHVPIVKKVIVHEPIIHEPIIHEPIIEHGGWW